MPRSTLLGTILNSRNLSNIVAHDWISAVQAGQTAGRPSKCKHKVHFQSKIQVAPSTYLQHSEADLSTNSKIFFLNSEVWKKFSKISRRDLESWKFQPMKSRDFLKVVCSKKSPTNQRTGFDLDKNCEKITPASHGIGHLRQFPVNAPRTNVEETLSVVHGSLAHRTWTLILGKSVFLLGVIMFIW